eukprot:m.212313 g.212313  ORF g.212313 m.212313 type:complete len:471 (-) comp26072_c0_seq1:57-1469(-)
MRYTMSMQCARTTLRHVGRHGTLHPNRITTHVPPAPTAVAHTPPHRHTHTVTEASDAWPFLKLTTRKDLLARTGALRPSETKLAKVVTTGSEWCQDPDPTHSHNHNAHPRHRINVNDPDHTYVMPSRLFDEDTGEYTGPRIGILGIPEDVGVVANFGRHGAVGGWNAFLDAFCHLQANVGIFEGAPAQAVVVVGEVQVADLQAASDKQMIITNRGQVTNGIPDDIAHLREVVKVIDHRVEAAVTALFRSGLTSLVVVGGGHNNAFPLARAAVASHDRRAPIAVVNLDPHADVRPTDEGRHSGNGFSMGLEDGCMGHYTLLGFNPALNPQLTHDTLRAYHTMGHPETNPAGRVSVIPLSGPPHKRFRDGVEAALESVLNLSGCQHLGMELDLDAVANMPSSAMSSVGFSVDEARWYTQRLATACAWERLPVRYLHIAEGAPKVAEDGHRLVGRATAQLACDFIAAQCRYLT